MDGRIIELYERYETCREVAEELGITNEMVRRTLIKHGIPRTHRHPKPGPKTNKRMPSNCRSMYCPAQVVMLRAVLGMPTHDIAKLANIPSDSVAGIIRRKRPDLKLQRCQRLPDSIIDSIERDYLAGNSTIAIGAKYRVSHTTVCKLMKRRGHERGKGGGPALNRINMARRDEAVARIVSEFGENGLDSVDSDDRREYRIFNRRRDSGITWKNLAKRNGSLVCEICGIECDPDDNEWGSSGPTHPTVDHVVRICDGGEDVWENVRLVCMKCNLEQNAILNRTSNLEAC